MPIFKGNIYWIIYPTKTQPPTSFPAYTKQERGRVERGTKQGETGWATRDPQYQCACDIKIKDQKETEIQVTDYIVQLFQTAFLTCYTCVSLCVYVSYQL